MKARRKRRAGTLGTVFTVVLGLAGPLPARAQGVQLGITPASLTVGTATEFELSLTVTQAGSPFNGFDATVGYDPAALTFLPLSPISLQQGCLMTGACSAACGNTFHRFAAAGDSLTITDVLLCNQITLTGPGQVYRLRFRASTVAQVTHVRIRRAAFYSGGVYVSPVVTADAQITIGPPVGVGDAPAAGVRLGAERNPGRAPVVFTIEADEAGRQEVEIHDVSGRRVRTLDRGWRAPGTRRVTWDGRDESGAWVPSGIYLGTLWVEGRAARVWIALLR